MTHQEVQSTLHHLHSLRWRAAMTREAGGGMSLVITLLEKLHR